MTELTYYQQLTNKLQNSALAELEELEEGVNIIVHKLKFIGNENRPTVSFISMDDETIQEDYLEELLAIAGAKDNTSLVNPQESDILIFKNSSNHLFSEFPGYLQSYFSEAKAFKDNKVFVIQNTNFGQGISTYLLDLESLAEIVQSKYFVYGHEGIEWIKFDLN